MGIYSETWQPIKDAIESYNELERNTLRLLEIIVYGFITLGFYIFLSWLLSVANKKIKEKHPTQKFDDFYKENGHSYDFVLVFKVIEDEEKDSLSEFQTTFSLKNILDRMINAQLECRCFYSCQRDEIYIKMRASVSLLKNKAAGVNYKLCLDPERVKLRLEAGNGDKWAPVKIMDQYKVSPFTPFEYIYGIYDLGEEYQALYKLYEVAVEDDDGKVWDFDTPFRSTDRIKLIISILESKITDSPPGCGLSVNDLLHKEAVLAAFPLHDYTILKDIQKKWLKLHARPSSQPISEIKDYFGERVGLYFAYLQHYVTWLIWPALLGVGTYVYGAVYYKSLNPLLPAYTTYMVFWSTFYIEAWKNKQATIAMTWGMTGFEDEQADRPQFFGDTITDIITGEEMTYFPDELRRPRDVLATAVQLLFVLLCLAIVIGIYGLQWEILSASSTNVLLTALSLSSSAFALVNSVFIRIVSWLWKKVATQLNDYQNHRTDTDYEDALVTKVFFVELINYNAGLFYVAFVKTFLGFKCVRNDCARDASSTVATLTLTNLVTRGYTEVIARMTAQKKKDEEESSGLEPGVEPSPIEQQYTLSEYSIRDTFNDYCSLILQYGYCTLIVGAYPLSSYWAFVSSYIQIRIDGWKLCQAHTRPRPIAAEDMGQWQNMLEILGACSVLTNAALICVVSRHFDDISLELRWVLFIVIEHAMFAVKYFVGEILPDVPEEVEMQLERQDFIVGKVLEDAPDDNDDEMDVQKDNTLPEIEKTDKDWDGIETEKEEEPEEE